MIAFLSNEPQNLSALHSSFLLASPDPFSPSSIFARDHYKGSRLTENYCGPEGSPLPFAKWKIRMGT